MSQPGLAGGGLQAAACVWVTAVAQWPAALWYIPSTEVRSRRGCECHCNYVLAHGNRTGRKDRCITGTNLADCFASH